jgi:hypothetical protein
MEARPQQICWPHTVDRYQLGTGVMHTVSFSAWMDKYLIFSV